ncbi:MAG: dihydropteroate synthase, partial [Christensenella sp.]|uniref:dihydropteroate synthase n=1 Tax=Christensenella sp. TaxID=1935934 RepID=UPI002B1F6A2C
IIGEKLNSSIPSTLEAMSAKNEEFVAGLAARQAAAGAHYLDINTGMCENEEETLVWAAKLARQAAPDCGIMADSTNPKALAYLFEQVELKNAIINSVTLEDERMQGVLPLVKQYKTGIVAMPLDGDGIPKTAERRVSNAQKLIEILRKEGVSDSDIYVDIVVEAAATGWDAPKEALTATRILREAYPDVHLLAGLSNISFGLPKRGIINQAFLACAMGEGMDAPIMDITNNAMKLHLCATQMLLGQDEYCMNYLTAYRETEA